MVTGESLPVKIKKDSKVIGGTLNKSGAFTMKVTKVGSETMLANIMNLIEDALTQKPEIQRVVDKVTSYFVPTVLVIALLAFVIWMLVNQDISNAVMHMVSVLVIACPCSLGLATPTAILVGVGVGSKRGVLIRNIQSLEQAKKIDCIVFDKTGTLTMGKLDLTDICPADG